MKVKAADLYGFQPGDVPLRPSPKAHAFWNPPIALQPEDTHHDCEDTCIIPIHCQLGLWSALAKAGLDVTLWTYCERVVGLPPTNSGGKLCISDARRILPWEVAVQWTRHGFSIKHIADYVRLAACLQEPGDPLLGTYLLLRGSTYD